MLGQRHQATMDAGGDSPPREWTGHLKLKYSHFLSVVSLLVEYPV